MNYILKHTFASFILMLNVASAAFAQSVDFNKDNNNDFLLNQHTQNGFWGDQGDGTFRNPVIASDFSDPDPVRVGDDYFMVASTFETSPGVTVLHSKDLVNWKVASHVFTHLEKVSPALTYKKMDAYSWGAYAPSIRYHDGMYYVYVNFISDGMFVGRTRNPFGEWDVRPLLDKNGKPMLLKGWTDPCPLWDEDGRAYLASSHPVKNWYGYLFQMSADGLQLLDADVEHMSTPDLVYEYPRGGTLYSRNYSTEGNKLYKRNGYYYLVHIEFLDGGNGAGTYIYRSRHIYGTKKDGTPGGPGDLGEYEKHRIDPHCQPYLQELPGQGGLVDLPDGRWYWIAQFNYYGSDGRTPCLLPVEWIDDWPVIGIDIKNNMGRMAWRLPKPFSADKKLSSMPIVLPHGSDDFSSPVLDKKWAWNHVPDSSRWSLTECAGAIRLYAGPTANGKDEFFRAANTLNQRYMTSDSVVITATISLSGTCVGQRAGMVHFNGGKGYAWMGIVHTPEGRYICYEQNSRFKQGPLLPASVNRIFVRSHSGYVPRNYSVQFNTEPQHFSYSTDGITYHAFGDVYQMGTANYRGDMVGLFTYNNEPGNGYIDVENFDYNVKNRPME